MSIESFIAKIEEEIDGIEPGTLTPETEFRSIDSWTSLHALIVIALVSVEYDVTITGQDLLNSKTIGDLYQLIQIRK